MSISISSALAIASYAAAHSFPNAAAPQRTQPALNNPVDTVTLTDAQQVYDLYNQGQKVPQIAFNLNLPVEVVNDYLGIHGASG